MKARWMVWLLLAAAQFASPAQSHAQADVAKRARTLIVGLDCDKARAELASADHEDPSVAIERARLAIYELDCDGAIAILAARSCRGQMTGKSSRISLADASA